MQRPDRRTPISRCEAAALYAQHAFRRYAALFAPGPETAAQLEAAAKTLEEAKDALVRAQAEYRDATVALLASRVEVKLIDLKADDVVRSVKRAADEAGKDVARAVFADGITPIVKPVGASEAKALRALEGRIAAASRWQGREAQASRVEAVRAEYEAALAARAEGLRAAADKRALRDAIKEDFLDAFTRVAAVIEGLFPRDRPRQDVFFDTLRASSARGIDDDEPDEPSAVEAEDA
jgi:hypothetical protein